jgi:spore coat protein U-like protein
VTVIKQSRKWFVALLFLTGTVSAQTDHVEVRTLADYAFGTYIDAGSVQLENDHCVSSANSSNPNPLPKDNPQRYPYRLGITGYGGDSTYYLYLDGNTAETGNRRVAIHIMHTDIFEDAGLYHELVNSAYETHSHLGQYRNCVQNGSNSRLRIEIKADELASKTSGNYSGTFVISALGGYSGTALDPGFSFFVSLTIASASEVQISALDAINLGSYAGNGSISASESFCVYSTALNGAYNIAITSSNQDASGNFFLVKDATGAKINYSLTFVDSAVQQPYLEVGNSSLSGVGNNTAIDCGGQNNAAIGVNIQEQALLAAETGTFSDSIVLLVQPE